MAPTHIELPSVTAPRFMSSELIGHALPPKERVMLMSVEQAAWILSVKIQTPNGMATHGTGKIPLHPTPSPGRRSGLPRR